MSVGSKPDRDGGARADAGAPPSPPVIDVRDLMQGGTLAQIVLDDRIYTLRITRADKLILTK
ncbi:hemin uptake protein HemP [Sulfitobacter sp. S190]|uniref:hemin uptake protein HemP n=1 Tax=Sulfitobacter sp. S190 TaxID=2867022 RepID=UPI0021A36CB1|nr:hemin uptake protein HemP [Sulfitobacter sp. S190]UWR21922.1 hemin uptake protein HemP [Sulfitobacter sp. S190]